jgi:hypothetical protein
VLVLVSFVLVLAAAVTLVVGLLQSGLSLIYVSIGCSVLAGVVLAVAVLRGRPEPKAAPIGRPFTPPASAPPQPVSVGAPSMAASAPAAATTTSFTPPPPPPPPPPSAGPASDDAATKAAGTALLGRLRGRRGDETPPVPRAPVVAPEPEPMTMEMPAVGDDEGFPIADYDELRATDLLRRLGALDRNELEAVRDRETEGKNRFTILSRIDTLLAAKEEPAWEVDDDEWEADADAEADATSVIAVGPVDDDEDEEDDDEDEFAIGALEDDEADELDELAADDDEDEEDEDEADVDLFDVLESDVDEVDELVSPVEEFPIAGYDSLTVGQILPRLSELDADELADVRAREQQGRGRGTILDRIDRLAAKSAVTIPRPGMAPPARRAPATRKTPAAKAAPAPRKARATKAAIPVPPATSTTPMKEAVKKAAARKSAKAVAAPPAPPMKEAVKKAAASKRTAPAKAAAAKVVVKKAPAAAKAPRKAATGTAASPMQEAVKKARAAKKRP